MRRWLRPLACAALGALAFLPSLRNGFINLDDDWNFAFNVHYRGLGLTQLRWMFTRSIGMGNYNPVHWLLLGAIYEVSGMKPFGYHLAALLLHGLAAALVFLVARRLYAAAGAASNARADAASTAAALLFALHPLRAEPVCWVSAQHYPLSTVFLLGAVLAYLDRKLAVSIGCFALAQLSLPIGAALPAILLLLDVYPLRRLPSDPKGWLSPQALPVLKEKIPYAVLSLLGLATVFSRAVVLHSTATYPLSASLIMPWNAAARGVWLTLAPFGLRPDYQPRGPVEPLSFGILVPALAALAFTVVLFLRRRSAPAAAAAWGFYLLALLPASGLVPNVPSPELLGDRYTYWPCLSFAVLGGALAPRFGRKPLLAGLALAAALIGLSWRQTAIWRDADALWDDSLARGQDDAWTHLGKGHALIEDGKPEQALAQLEAARELMPGKMQPYYALGYAQAQLGRNDEALKSFAKALELDPGSAVAYNALGGVLAASGRTVEAAKCFETAIRLEPDHAGAHLNLGLLLARAGRFPDAAAQFRLAAAANPDLPQARRALAWAQARAQLARP